MALPGADVSFQAGDAQFCSLQTNRTNPSIYHNKLAQFVSGLPRSLESLIIARCVGEFAFIFVHVDAEKAQAVQAPFHPNARY